MVSFICLEFDFIVRCVSSCSTRHVSKRPYVKSVQIHHSMEFMLIKAFFSHVLFLYVVNEVITITGGYVYPHLINCHQF